MGPKRLPPNSVCWSGTGTVLKRPGCAALLGAIVAEWSGAESMLASHYAQLVVGAGYQSVPIHPGGWIAMESFDTIISFGQRTTMLMTAARRRGLFTEDELDELADALSKLQKASKNRVIAAHGRWYICDTIPDALVWMSGSGAIQDAYVYDEPCLTALLQKIGERSLSLQMLFFKTFTPKLVVATQTYVGHLLAAKQREDGIDCAVGDPALNQTPRVIGQEEPQEGGGASAP